jgi:thioredoxin-like negative regulator of GroEL
MSRILAFFAAAVLSIVMTVSARAASYTKSAFDAAQKSGKPVLVHIHADWCPVCRKQQSVIQSLKGGKYKDLVVLTVDFDNQKDAVKKFGASMQSTLVAFKGASETGRLSYSSDSGQIEKVVASAF